MSSDEIQRYQAALDKMHKQWQDAINNQNQSVLNAKIKELSDKLTDATSENILLRKEIQKFKVQAQLSNMRGNNRQEDSSKQNNQGQNGQINNSSVEKNISDALEQAKNAQRLLTDKMLENDDLQRKIQNLEQDLAQANQLIQNYSSKPQAPQLNNQNPADNAQIIALTSQNDDLKNQLAKMVQSQKNQSEFKQQIQNLESQLALERKRKEEFESDFTLLRNQDRAIREKCDHLESQSKKNEKQLQEQEYELVRLGKENKEMITEKDSLLVKITDLSTQADKYYRQISTNQHVNKDMEIQIKNLSAQLELHDPKVLDEQRELIVDLRTKLNVFQREIDLVNKNSGQQIAYLEQKNQDLQDVVNGKMIDADARNPENLSNQQMRVLLAKSQNNLKEASGQIQTLKEELRLQSEFFENQSQNQNSQKTQKSVVKQSGLDAGQSKRILEEKNQQVKQMELKMGAMSQEKEAALEQIKVLQKELKLQEQYFKQAEMQTLAKVQESQAGHKDIRQKRFQKILH